MNLLHKVPTGENPPHNINAIIEVVSKSRDKYEYDDEYETFVLDRILLPSVIFPIDYGFIPRTWYEDNDPLDVMILSHEPLEVGCMVRCRPVGIMVMEDEKGEDSKILAVIENDPRTEEIKDIGDVPKHKLDEIVEFFKSYKRLDPEGFIKFKGWGDVEEAKETIQKSIDLYKEVKSVKNDSKVNLIRRR